MFRRIFSFSTLIIISFLCLLYIITFILGAHELMQALLEKAVGSALSLWVTRYFGWEWGILLALFFGGNELMVPSGSSGSASVGGSSNMGGSSRGSGWTSFDLDVIEEPWPNANEEGEEVAHPASNHPEEIADTGTTVAHNASLEASMRNRIARLEQDNSPFLLPEKVKHHWGGTNMNRMSSCSTPSIEMGESTGER